MGYDVHLEADVGGEKPAGIYDSDLGHLSWNYTSNVSSMLELALKGTPVDELDGALAGRVVPQLSNAIGDMDANPEIYKRMDPENGWGSYAGALAFLVLIRDGCRRHPGATLRIT